MDNISLFIIQEKILLKNIKSSCFFLFMMLLITDRFTLSPNETLEFTQIIKKEEKIYIRLLGLSRTIFRTFIFLFVVSIHFTFRIDNY